MKHLRTFEQVNEGVVDTIKEFLFPSIWRVSFTVTHKRQSKPAEKSSDGKDKTKTIPADKQAKIDYFKPQHKYWDVKAKTEEAAEEKFRAALSKELSGLEPQPQVEVTSIHKVKKMEYKNIKLY